MPLTRKEMTELRQRKRGYTGGGMRKMPEPERIEVLSRQEVMDWCQRTRNDYWQLSEMPVTAITLASLCNLRIENFQKVFDWDWEFSLPVLAKMTKVIDDIENRRVVWGHLSSPRSNGAGRGKTAIVYLEPPKEPSRLPRFCPRPAWNIFSVCQHCGGRKWLPVESDGKPHVACYTCLPRNQYAAIGVEASKNRLIREFVRSRHG